MTDAGFRDGADRPLNLMAADAEDLAVMSALLQDAVLPVAEMEFNAARRRFAMLVNRFRWEDAEAAAGDRRPYERVRALLTLEDVGRVSVAGFDRSDRAHVLSILSLSFAPGIDGTGRIEIVCADGAAIGIEVEAVSAALVDVTRPYRAPSGKAPRHDEAL